MKEAFENSRGTGISNFFDAFTKIVNRPKNKIETMKNYYINVTKFINILKKTAK